MASLSLKKIGGYLENKAGKSWLVCKKNSPLIFTGFGIFSLGASLITMHRAALKSGPILQKHKEKLAEMAEAYEVAQEDPDLEYDKQIYRQDLMVQTVQTGISLTKVYALPIGLGAASLTSFLVAENILNKRYLGAVCAFNAVSEAFSGYRERVRDEYGEKLDRHFLYGTEYGEETITVVDENGKKKKEKIETEETDSSLIKSPTAVFFDESNPNWDKNAGFNKHFLLVQQEVFTRKLKAKGYLFLNEVYEGLGFEAQPFGQLIGWVDGIGDGYVDFGISNQDDQNVRRFINGQENVVLLDFNHDGVIYDKI